MKTGGLNGIVANSKTRVRCVFCGVFIPKANKCIEQHTNGAKHKENIEEMTENGIIFINDMLYCKPCRVELTEEESVISHIESENHANWAVAIADLIDGEFIAIENYLNSDNEEVFCDVCNCNLLGTLQTIEAHVNNITHRINVTECLKPLNCIFPVYNSEEVWCKVCNAFIENTPQSIIDHIDDDNHMEWFTDVEDLIEDQDVSIDSYLKNEYENNAYCFRCHVEFLCDSDSILTHINSDVHLSHFS